MEEKIAAIVLAAGEGKRMGEWDSQTIYADQIKAFGVLCSEGF